MTVNMPRLKLANIRVPKNALVAKNISRIINNIGFIWRENMLGYLPLDIIEALFGGVPMSPV